MTEPVEVTVVAPEQWALRSDQLAALLMTDAPGSRVIPDPTGRPADPNRLAVVVSPSQWAADRAALREALVFTGQGAPATSGPNAASGAVAPVGDRLVYTVEEAATLLGISRSFAYEAVQRGEIPSMRIGKRILVPKAALERWLAASQSSDVTGADTAQPSSRTGPTSA